jgi:Tfp pilus assembly protein PilF
MARRHLAEAARRHPRSAAVALAVGRLESMVGNITAARDALRRTLDIEPGNATALAGLAWMALASGDALDAAAWISELGRIDGPRAKLQALRLHLVRGDIAAAKRSEELLLAGAADSVSTMYSIAEAYLAAGQARTAETWMRKAVDARPDVPEYWLLLSRAQVLIADRTGARRSVQRALEIRPAWLPASRHSMALYLADENLAGALAVLDELRAVGVAERTLQVMRGDLLLASGRYKDAAAAYAAMRSTGRDTREFMLRWVSARRSAGIADPLRPLVEYLAREPLDSQLRIALAEQLSQLGQPTAAIREYRRVLAHDADNVVALNNLAWLLAETGSGTLDEAVALAERALALAPSAPAVLDTAGWLLHRAGRAAEALPLLERAVDRRPHDRGMRQRLDQVRAALRDTTG